MSRRRPLHDAHVGAYVLAYILRRCRVDEDECWQWKLARDSHGQPVVSGKVSGGKSAKAHRLAWQAVGRALLPDDVLTAECGNNGCCNPEHRRRWKRAEWNSSDQKLQTLSRGPKHSAAITPKRRRASNVVHSMELARALRRRFYEVQNYSKVAREFSIRVSDAHRIISNKYWRDPNPFSI